MASKKEQKKVLDEWADGIQDAANEFLELALEMKEAGQSYEWPYLMGLFVDQMAAVARNSSPKMTKVQQKHAVVAFEAFSKGYESHRSAIDVKILDEMENLYNQATSLWCSMQDIFGIKALLPPKPPKPKEKEQLVLPYTQSATEYDVVISLPKGTVQEKVDCIRTKVQDLLVAAGGGTCAVSVGDDEKTEVAVHEKTDVAVHAGSSDQSLRDDFLYDTIIEEVLRHIPMPKKT